MNRVPLTFFLFCILYSWPSCVFAAATDPAPQIPQPPVTLQLAMDGFCALGYTEREAAFFRLGVSMAQDGGLAPLLLLEPVAFSDFSADARQMVLQRIQSWFEAAGRALTPHVDFSKIWERRGTGFGYCLFLKGIKPGGAVFLARQLEASVADHNATFPEMPIRLRLVLAFGRTVTVDDHPDGDVLFASHHLLQSPPFVDFEEQLWQTQRRTAALAATIPFFVAWRNNDGDSVTAEAHHWSDIALPAGNGQSASAKLYQPEPRSTPQNPRNQDPPPPSAPQVPRSEPLPERGPLPLGSKMPHRPNPDFVGRWQDLRQLDQLLHRGAPTVIRPLAAATGLSGLGKTQLAIEFAYRYGRLYPGGVFWLDFSDPNQVPHEIAACGVSLGLFEPDDPSSLAHQVQLVTQTWEKDGRPRLLIFDNCEEESLIHAWAPKSGHHRVLITSRCQTWTRALQIQQLPLGVLSRAESVALLQTQVPDLPTSQAEQLAAELGDLPLALYIAGSYLATYGDPETYLAELKTNPIASLSLAGASYQPTAHDLHVGNTFALSYQKLNPKKAVDETARQLLIRAACFAPGETIRPEDLFATLAETANKTRIDGLTRLKQLGLIGQERDQLVLHRLLVAFCQHTVPSQSQERPRAAVIETIVSLADKANLDGRPALMNPILAHLRFLTDAHFDQPSAESASLCFRLGWYLYNVASFREAEPYYRQALNHGERVHGTDHREIAPFLNNLARLLKTTNRQAEAEPLFRRALAIGETTLGPDHPHVAIYLNNLALLLEATNRQAEAEPLFRRALAIDETTFGPDHPQVATRLNNLGCLFRATNRQAEAEPFFRRALAIGETALGPDHPNMAIRFNNLAVLLRTTHREAEVEPLYRRALAIGETALGPDHPEVATYLNNLARLLEATNRQAEAEPLYRRALAIRQASLGLDHPNTQKTAKNLQSLLQLLGRQDIRHIDISSSSLITTLAYQLALLGYTAPVNLHKFQLEWIREAIEKIRENRALSEVVQWLKEQTGVEPPVIWRAWMESTQEQTLNDIYLGLR